MTANLSGLHGNLRGSDIPPEIWRLAIAVWKRADATFDGPLAVSVGNTEVIANALLDSGMAVVLEKLRCIEDAPGGDAARLAGEALKALRPVVAPAGPGPGELWRM